MYKRHGIQQLGLFCDAYADSLDIFCEVKEFLIETALTDKLDEDKMDVDDHLGRPVLLLIRATAFEALGKCFPKSQETQRRWSNEMCTFFAKHGSDESLPWNIKIAILTAIESWFDKLDTSQAQLTTENVRSLLDAIILCLQDPKYVAVRESALSAMKKCRPWFEASRPEFEQHRQYILDALPTIAKKEAAPNLQQALKDIVQHLQK